VYVIQKTWTVPNNYQGLEVTQNYQRTPRNGRGGVCWRWGFVSDGHPARYWITVYFCARPPLSRRFSCFRNLFVLCGACGSTCCASGWLVLRLCRFSHLFLHRVFWDVLPGGLGFLIPLSWSTREFWNFQFLFSRISTSADADVTEELGVGSIGVPQGRTGAWKETLRIPCFRAEGAEFAASEPFRCAQHW
jgi:hypothetical protein